MAKLGALLVLFIVVIWAKVQAGPCGHPNCIKHIHNPHHGALSKRFLQLGRREQVPAACQKKGATACNGNGVCLQHSEGYYCSCNEGWGGEDCDVEDVCANTASNPCQNDAYCYFNPWSKNGYDCGCNPGYIGQHCEHECALDGIMSDYYSELYSIQNIDTHDKAVAQCSGLVGKLVKAIEQSLAKSCHCEKYTFEDIGALLSDKDKWIEERCVPSIYYRPYDPNTPMCSDKDIMDCLMLVSGVHHTLYPGDRKRDLAADTQKLIVDSVACMTKLQTKNPWPAECSEEKSALIGVPPKVQGVIWNLQEQGCYWESLTNKCGEGPFEQNCASTNEEFKKVANDYLDCLSTTAITMCKYNGLSENKAAMIQEMFSIKGDLCPDYQPVKDLWAKSGCTNTPPWEKTESVRAFEKKVEQVKRNKDLSKLLSLLQRALGDSNRK